MIKKIVGSLFFFMTISLTSQTKKMSDFKYIIVPNKFDFLKKSNQYQTSSLTKFLLQKKGFRVFLSTDSLPVDLLQNRCLALTAIVSDASGVLIVKNKIALQDCFGTLVYASKFGKSKEKEYKKAYHEAIRKAYATMTDLKFVYKPEREVDEKKEVNHPKERLIAKKEIPLITPSEAIKATPEKALISNQIQKDFLEIETLSAQFKNNGFQLVNTKPEVVFQLLQTNLKEVFILKGSNGIFYKKGIRWIAEYYENSQLIQKEYLVNF
jgi:hypothetical protein